MSSSGKSHAGLTRRHFPGFLARCVLLNQLPEFIPGVSPGGAPLAGLESGPQKLLAASRPAR